MPRQHDEGAFSARANEIRSSQKQKNTLRLFILDKQSELKEADPKKAENIGAFFKNATGEQKQLVTTMLQNNEDHNKVTNTVLQITDFNKSATTEQQRLVTNMVSNGEKQSVIIDYIGRTASTSTQSLSSESPASRQDSPTNHEYETTARPVLEQLIREKGIDKKYLEHFNQNASSNEKFTSTMMAHDPGLLYDFFKDWIFSHPFPVQSQQVPDSININHDAHTTVSSLSDSSTTASATGTRSVSAPSEQVADSIDVQHTLNTLRSLCEFDKNGEVVKIKPQSEEELLTALKNTVNLINLESSDISDANRRTLLQMSIKIGESIREIRSPQSTQSQETLKESLDQPHKDPTPKAESLAQKRARIEKEKEAFKQQKLKEFAQFNKAQEEDKRFLTEYTAFIEESGEGIQYGKHTYSDLMRFDQQASRGQKIEFGRAITISTQEDKLDESQQIVTSLIAQFVPKQSEETIKPATWRSRKKAVPQNNRINQIIKEQQQTRSEIEEEDRSVDLNKIQAEDQTILDNTEANAGTPGQADNYRARIINASKEVQAPKDNTVVRVAATEKKAATNTNVATIYPQLIETILSSLSALHSESWRSPTGVKQMANIANDNKLSTEEKLTEIASIASQRLAIDNSRDPAIAALYQAIQGKLTSEASKEDLTEVLTHCVKAIARLNNCDKAIKKGLDILTPEDGSIEINSINPTRTEEAIAIIKSTSLHDDTKETLIKAFAEERTQTHSCWQSIARGSCMTFFGAKSSAQKSADYQKIAEHGSSALDPEANKPPTMGN